VYYSAHRQDRYGTTENETIFETGLSATNPKWDKIELSVHFRRHFVTKRKKEKGMLEMWRPEVVHRWPHCDHAQVTFIDPYKGRLSPCYCRGHSSHVIGLSFVSPPERGVEQSTSIFMRTKIIQMAGREKTYGLFYFSQ
jgi:hypothetical protein